MKTRWIYSTLLETALVGIVVSVFMAYVALDHNPQDEFYDSVNRRVVTENLLPVMLSWFIACAVVYGASRAVLTLLLRKLRR